MTTNSLTMPDTLGLGFEAKDFGVSSILTTNQYTTSPAALDRVAWGDAVTARLAELERLPPNWDSDGALPVARRHANRALALLSRLVVLGFPPIPDIVPLADGGVQLEWRLENGLRVDFVSDEDSEPVVLIEDATALRECPAASMPIADFHAILAG
jgi:hypothetical protein